MDIKNFIMNIKKDVENGVIDGYKCEVVDAVYNEAIDVEIVEACLLCGCYRRDEEADLQKFIGGQ